MSVWYSGGVEHTSTTTAEDAAPTANVVQRLVALEALVMHLVGVVQGLVDQQQAPDSSLMASKNWCLSMFPRVSRPPNQFEWWLSNNGVESLILTDESALRCEPSRTAGAKVGASRAGNACDLLAFSDDVAHVSEYTSVYGARSITISGGGLAQRVPVDYCIPRVSGPAANSLPLTVVDTPWGLVQTQVITEQGANSIVSNSTATYLLASDPSVLKFVSSPASKLKVQANGAFFDLVTETALAVSSGISVADADQRYWRQSDTRVVQILSGDSNELLVSGVSGTPVVIPTKAYVGGNFLSRSQADGLYKSIAYAPDLSSYLLSSALSNILSSYVTFTSAGDSYVSFSSLAAILRRYVRSRHWDTYLDASMSLSNGNYGLAVKWKPTSVAPVVAASAVTTYYTDVAGYPNNTWLQFIQQPIFTNPYDSGWPTQ